jgi:hypothetical protein
MKLLAWIAGAYVAIGVFKCMTMKDGHGYPSDCPTVLGVGLPAAPARCLTPSPCSNKSLDCILKWWIWSPSRCNDHF